MDDTIPDTGTLFELQGVRFLDVFTASVAIPAGETTLIRGRSGSGKSTLLRMLNRMIMPSDGNVLYRGQDLTAIEPVEIRRRVVMLSQSPVLFGGSVRDEATAGRRFASLPEIDDRTIREALDAVQLAKELDEVPTNFSGGERQRLCLARVLLMDPPVLLLDEPTVGLDRETEEAVFACIRDWRDDGRSVVAASHSTFTSMLGTVNRLEFENGRLVQEAAR